MYDFAMYTKAGNLAVAGVIEMAKHMNWSWTKTEEALHRLSYVPGFEEAMDTAVREMVFVTLGYDKSVV